MIVVTVDGLNFKYAKEYYSNIFPEQSMKMIRNNVSRYSPTGPTGLGLACLWSGEHIRNFHSNLFMNLVEKDNKPKLFLKKNGEPMDLIWNHFKNPKYYEKSIGPNPYMNNQTYWKQYDELLKMGVRFAPCEELSVFAETARKDYDLFWIHSAIIKFANPAIGPYEQGRNPGLLTYDDIRKDKELKKRVYILGIRRYVEVIKYLQELARPNELFVITSDHGTMVDLPYSDNQIDEIPVIVNRNVDLSNINYQWDIKDLILKLYEDYGRET